MTSHRGLKTGLDYFSFDVDFFEDQKVQFIGAKYGILGEYVVIRLLCKIYRNGYYLPWGDDECLLFTRSCVPEATPDQVQEIILEAVNRRFFDAKRFSRYSILTSNGIQSRFFEATRRRKRLTIYKQFLIADIEGYNVSIIELDDDISPQSKGKEGKEGKKEKNSAFSDANAPPRAKDQPQEFYLTRKKKKLSGRMWQGFEAFWNIFDWKKDKAKAADAWLETVKVDIIPKVIDGAKAYAAARQGIIDSGHTPKWAEGWIRARRWEDELVGDEAEDMFALARAKHGKGNGKEWRVSQ